MKKKLVVVISIGMILICGSVFAITAVVNSNYEKESIEKSSKVINNNVEENLDSIYFDDCTFIKCDFTKAEFYNCKFTFISTIC